MLFVTSPYFDGNLRSTSISQLRAGKTQSKKCLPPFHIDILKAESVAVLRCPRPEKFEQIFRLKIFGDGAIYENFLFFTNFHFTLVKKIVGLLRTQF